MKLQRPQKLKIKNEMSVVSGNKKEYLNSIKILIRKVIVRDIDMPKRSDAAG
jgi:hypothetical protein